ncbi:MAG: hypothetical protein ACRDR6_31030 [Pseudonocardiaceae bacterium]
MPEGGLAVQSFGVVSGGDEHQADGGRSTVEGCKGAGVLACE